VLTFIAIILECFHPLHTPALLQVYCTFTD